MLHRYLNLVIARSPRRSNLPNDPTPDPASAPIDRPHRHSREGGNPGGFIHQYRRQLAWIPAFAGMTVWAVVAAFACNSTAETPAPTLNVISYNVLVELSTEKGVPAWNERKQLAVDTLKKNDPDLVGMQENTPNQRDFFTRNLPGFTVLGAIPLEGKEFTLLKNLLSAYTGAAFNEYTDALLFYKTALFDKLDEGHTWLSPTPDHMSNGYGNFMPRIVIWAKLKYKPTGKTFLVLVTHFDNTSPSQKFMSKQMADYVPTLMNGVDEALFIGDFNSKPGSDGYQNMITAGWQDPVAILKTTGPTKITTPEDSTGEGQRIDHIFYRGELLKPITWRRLEAATRLSDHYPVFTAFEVK